MPDPTPPAPTAEPTTPPAPEPTTPPTTPPEPTLGPDGKPWDPERAGRTIAQQRETEKAAKEEAERLRAKLKEYEEKDLTEQQRLEREAEEAKAKVEQAEAREATASAALRRGNLLAELAKPEHGIVDASAAATLIEGVEYDDAGAPTNLGTADQEDSLIAKFLTAKSFLKATPATPARPAPPSLDARPTGEQPTVNLTAEELEAAKKAGMSPQQYEARKNARTFEDWQRIRAQERAAQQ